MAGGWSRDGAVQDQIDASVDDAVKLARSLLPGGKSASICEECGEGIPLARQTALPGVQFCVSCQTEFDKTSVVQNSLNRRGSKDSQLR